MKHLNKMGMAVGMAFGMMGVAAGQAWSTTIVADKDAYVRGDGPNINSTDLSMADWVGSPTSLTRHTVISFDLSAFDTAPGFVSATLRLGIPTNGNPGTHEVSRLLRDFHETQVTWSEYSAGNAWQAVGGLGASDSTVIATGVSSGNTSGVPWAGGGLDVTAAANAWVGAADTIQLGFLVRTETRFQNYLYGSTESGNGPGPGPVLEFELVPEPGSVALIGLGGIGLAWWRRRKERG